MFHIESTDIVKKNRFAIAGILALSVAALVVTIWIMKEFLREQEIVRLLIKQLPQDAKASAEELAGELRWQFRLITLVVLNLVVTAFAVILLWRAYQLSQESLRDFKALAADILSSMAQGVITTDLNGIVTSINQKGMELLEIRGNVLGQPLAAITDAVPLEELRITARSSEAASIPREHSFLINGVSRTLSIDCHPLCDHSETEIGQVIQLWDVSERVLMDERMRRMERYMGLGSLAVGLHHEIKNPLAALSLHVQLLEEEADQIEVPDEIHQMLGVIKQEVSRIGGVLENFRDFASIGNLHRSEIDLASLMEQQIRFFRPRAEQHGIEVQLQLPKDPLPSILADRIRLEQVLINLLINAMEAMPQGGRINVTVEIVEESTARWLNIAIADSGCGIPEKIRDRIFDPYFTTKSDGTGMGLAICDKIIRQHLGRLECRSSDSGTVFEIQLPIELSISKIDQDQSHRNRTELATPKFE